MSPEKTVTVNLDTETAARQARDVAAAFLALADSLDAARQLNQPADPPTT